MKKSDRTPVTIQPTSYQRMLMLEDAGYDITPLMKAYARCIDFLREMSDGHELCGKPSELCNLCSANTLLEELGETDNAKD